MWELAWFDCFPFLEALSKAAGNGKWNLLFTIGGAVMNALAFSGTIFFFHNLIDQDDKECKTYNLALEKLQKDRDECNNNKIKQYDFINKRLHRRNEARAYISNVDEAMVEYF